MRLATRAFLLWIASFGLVLLVAYSTLQLRAQSASSRAEINQVFLGAAILSLLAALMAGALLSRSLARPILNIVDRLHASERTGLLESGNVPSGIRELRALSESLDRAAAAVAGSHDRLVQTYIEFIASLSSALDARDGCTNGHSRRVSDYAVTLARDMALSAEEIETIRIGALLHDVGKIGVLDAVLQKTGRLTPAEFAIVQKHPLIGRRILERIRGFERYLPIVELHHENWDGSGYPYRLRGLEVSRGARIVHLADAFDAMTMHRPYRRHLGKEKALQILREAAGSQFDPGLTARWIELVEAGKIAADLPWTPPLPPGEPDIASVVNLAEALNQAAAGNKAEETVAPSETLGNAAQLPIKS